MSNIYDINGGPPSVPQPKVDISTATDVVCKSCGSIFFHPVTYFKKISALVSPTGKDAMIPIETYACLECGSVNSEFIELLPPDVRPKSVSRPDENISNSHSTLIETGDMQ